MKRVLSILGISLLSTGLFANQNTNSEDIDETNAIQSEEQVLELDENNADYWFESFDFSKITGALSDLANKIKTKLSGALSSAVDKICPDYKGQAKEAIAGKWNDVVNVVKQKIGDNPNEGDFDKLVRDGKYEIRKLICPKQI